MRTYYTNIYHKNLLLQNINVLLIKLGFPHKVLKANSKKGLSFKAICFCLFFVGGGFSASSIFEWLVHLSEFSRLFPN